MAVSYSYQKLPLPFPSIPSRYSTHFLFTPQLSSHPRSPALFSLRSTSDSHSPPFSSPSIFLPYLDHVEEEETERDEELSGEALAEEQALKPRDDGQDDDPFVRFFKSRSGTTKDPRREGKFSLQLNRRSSWHLAPTKEFEEGAESDPAVFEEEEKESPAEEESPAEGIAGEIIRIARNLPENLTLGEALEGFEGGRVSETECVEVLGILGKEGLLMDCLYFFEWMGLKEPSLVTPRSCTILFPLLGRAGMGDKLMVLFHNLPKNPEFGDVHVYNAAISGLMCSKRYEDAWKVYETMESNNVKPDHVTCSIMITTMRKVGRSAKESWEFFEKMNRKGVKWSPEILGALIKAFCDEGLRTEALVIQNEMARKGIFPNAIIYNTLMDAYCKSNRIEEAEGLFGEMRAKGIAPISSTFNILMDAYSRRSQPEVVEKLLEEMRGLGLDPNAKSFTCLISAYARERMSDRAADAFLRMRRLGISPTSHSYTALIHAFSVTGWHEKAYAAFEEMRARKIKPSVETYTALLDAFRRAGDAETLMAIWKTMMKEKVTGSRVTFNTVVDGFAKQGRYAEARDAIFEFGKLGFPPTLLTFNMLVNAYARGGQHSKIPQLLREMASHGLKPDSVTFSTMIYAFVRVRDFKRAFVFHKMMVKSGQVPDPKSYEKMRSILDVKAAGNNDKDKKAILGIVNSKMGMVKAKRKGKKDEFWKYRKAYVKPVNSASVRL